MLDQAFDALKSYDWGVDTKALKSIEEAVVATRDDSAARKELETRLAGLLSADISRDAKDYVCRKLMVVGTALSVPALAALLPDKELSHMARYALERIPTPEAAQALRDALAKVTGPLRIGVIGSLGSRRDAAAVSTLATLVGDADAAVARAAAIALGAICTTQAAEALAQAKPATDEAKLAITDATLACAEARLAQGDKTGALATYKKLAADNQPKHIRLAATRGMLACAGKSD